MPSLGHQPLTQAIRFCFATNPIYDKRVPFGESPSDIGFDRRESRELAGQTVIDLDELVGIMGNQLWFWQTVMFTPSPTFREDISNDPFDSRILS